MTSRGGTGSGHFSLLIAYLRLFGTHMSLVAILLLSEIPIDRYIKIPDYISIFFRFDLKALHVILDVPRCTVNIRKTNENRSGKGRDARMR